MREQIPNSLNLDELLLNKKYEVNYYQREYRWGEKQIEQLLSDLSGAFFDSYYSFSDNEKNDLGVILKMDYYYMGSIIVTKEKSGNSSIIDGQQRLTSLTLLLIALKNINSQFPANPELGFEDPTNLIYSQILNKKSFNINVPSWSSSFDSLLKNQPINENISDESVKNISRRYKDIIEKLQEIFKKDDLNEVDGDLISLFNSWIRYRTIFIKIETPSEQDAHKVFVSMNDRGLSLNPSEMLKGYLLSEISDDDKRNEANNIWKSNVLKLKESEQAEFNGEFNTEDMNFLSTWIRAKYAQTLRTSKKGSEDMDYEIIGREFHEWVRKNHQLIGLNKSEDYYNFIKYKFSFFTEQYLRIKKYSKEFTKGFEAVFYNADKQVTYQPMLILATLDEYDKLEVTDTKIKLVSTYLDQYSARRIFNFSKFGWNGIKYEMFYIMKSIRGLDLNKLTVALTQRLNDMRYKIDGIVNENFYWNQFTGKYILHVLARFTDYVEVLMGNDSNFPSYVNRNIKNSYDREHVLPDKYEDYRGNFSSPEEFKTYRWKLGNLVLLKLDKNRSYQDMNYSEKKEYYFNNNILASSFNSKTYTHNPKFINLVVSKYPFKPYEEINKIAIDERQKLYQLIALDIYDVNKIKSISNAWDDEYAVMLIQNRLEDSVNLDVLHGNLENSTFKKPVFIEIDGYKISCSSYADMTIRVINHLLEKDKELLEVLAKQSFCNKVKYINNDADKESLKNSMLASRETNDLKVLVDVHGSGKELVLFVRQLLNRFSIENAMLYLK